MNKPDIFHLFNEIADCSPPILVSDFLEVVYYILESYESGALLPTDYMTFGIEDGYFTVNVYSKSAFDSNFTTESR